MPPSDNLPDFDSMSPEELQAWMETLAERQGATEGFTTENRMDIGEVDPDSVEFEDKYIPYGKTAEEWAEIQQREREEREARRTIAGASRSGRQSGASHGRRWGRVATAAITSMMPRVSALPTMWTRV